MSCKSYDPKNDPTCSMVPRNVDMDGVAVAVANVVVHWCLRFMVTYSHGDIDLAIQSLLVQFYPILLSTLLSVKRKNSAPTLSLFDADFALLLSSSPLAICLSFASVCDLCGIRTGLFKRIRSHRHIIRTLGAWVPFLWTALSLIENLSTTAFLDSPCNSNTNFLGWLGDTTLFLITSLLSPGRHIMGPRCFRGIGPTFLGPGLLPLAPFFVLLFRRRSQVWADVQLCLDGASRLRVPFTWVKCAWCTIDRQHKWCVHFLFVWIDAIWSVQIVAIASIPDVETYVLSYGQVLALFFILPTLISTIEFCCSPRLNSPLQLLTEHGYAAEARYFFTGKEPDQPIRDSHLPFNVISHPEKPTASKPRDQMAVSVPQTRQTPCSPELDHTMGKWVGA